MAVHHRAVDVFDLDTLAMLALAESHRQVYGELPARAAIVDSSSD